MNLDRQGDRSVKSKPNVYTHILQCTLYNCGGRGGGMSLTLAKRLDSVVWNTIPIILNLNL